MAFWDAMAALTRRWYVIVPLLLVASLATVGTMKIVKPTYEAQAQLLMLNPPTASDSKLKINPYLSFSDALGITGDAVSRVVQSDAYVRSIAAQGGTATFQLAMRADALAPVMNVVASDHDPAVALRTERLVIQAIGRALRDQQQTASAPHGSLITYQVLSESPQPRKLLKKRLQALIALAVLGFGLSIGVTLGLDGVLTRRRSRRRELSPQKKVVPLAAADQRAPGEDDADWARARPRTRVPASER